MTAVVACLLGLAALAALVGALACARLSTPLEKLHAVGVVNVAAGCAVILAALVADGFTARSLKCVLILALMLLGGAVTTHAAGRAIHLRGGDRR